MKKTIAVASILCCFLTGCLPVEDSGGGGGGGGSYYVSATGCTSGYSSYSYNGPSYSSCNYYYQMAANSACSKILDNCR